MRSDESFWNFWVDKGGTFTDIIARSPNNKIHTKKILSSTLENNQDPIITGIRSILRIKKNTNIPIDRIKSINVGTTIATNALLENKGDNTLLLTTEGFGDSLEIGYQSRPKLFDLNIKKNKMLYTKVVEVEERIDVNGKIIKKLDLKKEKQKILKVLNSQNLGIKSIAINLMHAWKYPNHEIQLLKLLKEIGFNEVSSGHDISPTIKFIKRGDTTVLNAYLSPIVSRDISNLRHALFGKWDKKLDNEKLKINYMQSNGGLSSWDQYRAKDSILSGPAGGIIGAISTSQKSGFNKIISFDMGGTSTDVAHFNKKIERSFENDINGIRIQIPMLEINTIASGGGSLLTHETGRLVVSEQSAGSFPGPACYNLGGPLTVTDANLILGKISNKNFPKVFGHKGKSSLNKKITVKKFQELKEDLKLSMSIEEIADGYINIAIEKMTQAIKKISVNKGHNLDNYAIASFGGAGGQHACLLAENLGINKILIHPLGSFLSAYGIGFSSIKYTEQKSILCELNDHSYKRLNNEIRLSENKNLLKIGNNDYRSNISVYIKYQDSEMPISIEYSNINIMKDNFLKLHKKQFGFLSDKKIFIDMVEVETELIEDKKIHYHKLGEGLTKTGETNIFTKGNWHKINIYDLQSIALKDKIYGPALISDKNSTIVIEPDWTAKIDSTCNLILTKIKKVEKYKYNPKIKSPILLEIFNNLFMSIAEQMGITLQKTSISVNIKERLDYSCAIFDKKGDLIANAPHVPIHLGSMDDCVKNIIKNNKEIYSGDVFLINSPQSGGTHLPDLTIITPIFSSNKIIFFLGSRGHHSDIGGIYPGSMSPLAKTLDEEGVVFHNFKIMKKGNFNEKELLEILTLTKYPARNPFLNIEDIKAQIAANTTGSTELIKVIGRYGLPTLEAYMEYIKFNSEESVIKVIKVIKDASFEVSTDHDFKIKVSLKVIRSENRIVIDFDGTSKQQNNSFNAPLPITKAVILYVFRCLIDKDIPLNSGILKPITILIPENSILSPGKNAAVSAGNVETSQVIANCLLGALGIIAGSQGTMNNIVFGNDNSHYYETICGGSGAGKYFNGTSAVQSNMTNSKLTDPEIIENQYPVEIFNIYINRNTGGEGLKKGGDGIVKTFLFQSPMECSIISNNRIISPFGLCGGKNGTTGQNYLIRKNKKYKLSSCEQLKIKKGDKIEITTPSGGGYGSLKKHGL